MPFVLIVSGSVLLIAAVRDSQQKLYALVGGDFTGQNNFIYWFLSILVIGAIGYIPRMKPVSDGFLILVILVLFLSKGGFFDQFQRQIGITQTSKPQVSSGTGAAGSSFVATIGGTGATVGTGGGSVSIGAPGGTVTVGV